MKPKILFIVNIILAISNAALVVCGILAGASVFSIVCGSVTTAIWICLAAWAWADIEK